MINKKVNSIKEITADQFKQKLSDKGYYISSSMNEQSPKYLKIAYTAISKDQTHDIKFYEAQTDEDALTNVFLKEKEAIVKEQNKKVEKDIKEEKVSVNPVKTITKKDLEAIYGQRKNEPGFYEAIDIVNEALEKDKK